MDWLLNHWNVIVEGVGYFYLGATALATVTPSGKTTTTLEKIGSFLDRIGCKIKK